MVKEVEAWLAVSEDAGRKEVVDGAMQLVAWLGSKEPNRPRNSM
jgi:hypothetical protein